MQHVIQSLIAKRAEIAGIILDLERRIARHRAELVHIDSTIAMFDDTVVVDEIKPKRPYVRSRYFAAGELTRFCREALRDASGPVSATDIAIKALTERKLDTDDAKIRSDFIIRILRALGQMKKRGNVEQIGAGKGSKWAFPELS